MNATVRSITGLASRGGKVRKIFMGLDVSLGVVQITRTLWQVSASEVLATQMDWEGQRNRRRVLPDDLRRRIQDFVPHEI